MGPFKPGTDQSTTAGFFKTGGLSALVPALTAGGSNAVIMISVEISFAAMVFSGALSGYLSQGVGIFLLGTFIISLITTLKSSHPSTLAVCQDIPVVILTLPIAAIIAAMPGGQDHGDSLFYTVLLTMATATLLTGILMMLTARFRLANFVRFVPYPVIGGFLAGIGWLLVKSGISVMTQLPVDLSSLPSLFASATLIKWIPGLIFAIMIYGLLRTYTTVLILPGMVLAGIVLFFLALHLGNIPLSQAEAQGWFLGPFPKSALWTGIPISALSRVRWDLVIGQALSMASLFLLSSISLLLNASGLELISKRDIDLNAEIRTAGLANILASFTGCTTGYMALSPSALCHKLNPGSRLSGAVFVMILGAAIAFGPAMVSHFPRPLAGAMLVFMGVDMLWDWLVLSRSKLPKSDYAMVLVILTVVASLGFLQGVGAGIVIAVILFVINYSKISIVRSCTSGRRFRSNVERAAPQRWILNRKGDQILILQLHGFIFFGTANQLRAKITEEVTARDKVRFVILDVARVNGLDSSALNSFERLRQFAGTLDITLVLVHMSQHLEDQFKSIRLPQEDFIILPDLDHGIEWCEDRVLGAETSDTNLKAQAFDSTYDDMWEALDQMEAFERLLADMAPYLTPNSITPEQYLFKKGESTDGIFLVESGQIVVLLESEGKPGARLRTMGHGSVIGDLGDKALGETGTSVKGITTGQVFHLSEPMQKKMESQAPELSLRLYKYMSQVLAERLARSNTMIRDLI